MRENEVKEASENIFFFQMAVYKWSESIM